MPAWESLALPCNPLPSRPSYRSIFVVQVLAEHARKIQAYLAYKREGLGSSALVYGSLWQVVDQDHQNPSAHFLEHSVRMTIDKCDDGDAPGVVERSMATTEYAL